jgi:hypothetical protein
VTTPSWATAWNRKRLKLPNGSRVMAGAFLPGVRLAGAWLLDLDRWKDPGLRLLEIVEAMDGIPPDDPCVVLSSTASRALDVLRREGWQAGDVPG